MVYEGDMRCYFYYGYDLTKYKNKLSKKILEEQEIYGVDCYQDTGEIGYLEFKNRLFIGYIAANFDGECGSEIVPLDKKDFGTSFKEFKKLLKKLEQKTNIKIDIEPEIICYTEKSDSSEKENYSPSYSYLSYYLIYGYELYDLEVELDNRKLKKLGYKTKQLKTNETGFLMFEEYGCSLIAGYIVEKISSRRKYHTYEEFYKIIKDIKQNEDMLKISQTVTELHKKENKKTAELKLYAVKIDNPE